MSRYHHIGEGIGPTEIIIVLVVLFILFGHRLPSVMRSLGRDVLNLPADRIYEERRWSREPSASKFDMYLIGGGIFLMLAIVAFVAVQLLLRR